MSVITKIIDFINCIGYREFKEEEIKAWTKRYKEKSRTFSADTKDVVSQYCKQDKPKINESLRKGRKLSEQGLLHKEKLDHVLSEKIGENIVVYRNLTFNPFIENGVFIEKGYMSTSLQDGVISAVHNGKYMLKILVPSECRGFYVDYISCRHGEYEMLLARNIKLEKILSVKQSERTLILCKAKWIGGEI